NKDEGANDLGDGGADVAGTENSERSALGFRRIPFRDVGYSDSKRTASDANAKRSQQEGRVIVSESQQPGGDGCREHDRGIDEAAAVLVGPDAENEADQRAGQDGRANQQTKLGVVEVQVLFDLHADD